MQHHLDSCLHAILELVSERTGLAIPSFTATAHDAILRQMSKLGLEDARRYLARVRTDGEAYGALVAALTVGETYFFRTSVHFDFIRDELVPKWRAQPGRRIQLWSAGCASGEEAWSLAALMHSEGLADRTHVLATDVSLAALERGRAGEYGEWSFRGTDAWRMRPYLEPSGKRLRITSTLRPLVQFLPLNFAEPVYRVASQTLESFDFIFCRNVLIYFRPEVIAHTARRLFEALAPEGILVPGPSDPPLTGHAGFSVLVRDWGLVLQRPAPGAAALSTRTPVQTKALDLPWPSPAPGPIPPALPPAVPAPPPARVAAAEPPQGPPPERPSMAAEALAQGRWREASELASTSDADPESLELRIRAMANLDPDEAERLCREAVLRHPLMASLRHHHALLLLTQGRREEALQVARETLYLVPDEPAAYLLEAHVSERLSDLASAIRSYRQALARLERLPADHPLPLTDGERASQVASQVRRRLQALEGERS